MWCCMTLVNSLVTSQLDYGNVMLYGLPVNITNKLQRVQNTTARLISRTMKHQHITPILVSLHWLPGTIVVNINFWCTFLNRYTAVHPSIYRNELASINQHVHCDQRTALIKPPRMRTKTYGERLFDKAAATLWNILPGQLRNEQSLFLF
jgi:hypothetical protein